MRTAYAYALTVLCAIGVRCMFTEHFNRFVLRKHGKEALKFLGAIDDSNLLTSANTTLPEEYISGRALVIVKDINRPSEDLRLEYLKRYGYNRSRLFVITPGVGIGIPSVRMQVLCEYFKQVRLLIELLYEYSRRKVDVISIAIGTVVARKAILGGSCYDKDENLGKSITDKGELNAQPSRFEGSRSYSLYSYSDEEIGTDCCGHHCGQLRHANHIFVYNTFNHQRLLITTQHKQMELLIGNATADSELLFGISSKNSSSRNVIAYRFLLLTVIQIVLFPLLRR